MKIKKVTLLNKKKFVKDMYIFSKNQNDLKFISSGIIEKIKLDISYYSGYIAKQIEDTYKEIQEGDKITVKMFDKNESYLNEEIKIPFLVKTVTEDKIRLKYLN